MSIVSRVVPAEQFRYLTAMTNPSLALAGIRVVDLSRVLAGPFCGALLNNKASGIYACRLCGLPLFKASTKFESGSGWPSFYQPFDELHIRELRDTSHGMIRVEIRCRRCDGHLGHVFDDGPAPTHKRYCLNSLSLQFVPDGEEPAAEPEHAADCLVAPLCAAS